jgi:hypothetical protein
MSLGVLMAATKVVNNIVANVQPTSEIACFIKATSHTPASAFGMGD